MTAVALGFDVIFSEKRRDIKTLKIGFLVAQNHQRTVARQLRQAAGNLRHGYPQALVEGADRDFPGFADIEHPVRLALGAEVRQRGAICFERNRRRLCHKLAPSQNTKPGSASNPGSTGRDAS